MPSDRVRRVEMGQDRTPRKVGADKTRVRRRIKQTVAGTIFLAVLGAGWFYPLVGYFIPLCMLLGIGLATFRGRSWCNWLCPRGSFEDAWRAGGIEGAGGHAPPRRLSQVQFVRGELPAGGVDLP